MRGGYRGGIKEHVLEIGQPSGLHQLRPGLQNNIMHIDTSRTVDCDGSTIHTPVNIPRELVGQFQITFENSVYKIYLASGYGGLRVGRQKGGTVDSAYIRDFECS